MLKVEQGKDGTLDTKLFDARAEKQGDLTLYTLVSEVAFFLWAFWPSLELSSRCERSGLPSTRSGFDVTSRAGCGGRIAWPGGRALTVLLSTLVEERAREREEKATSRTYLPRVLVCNGQAGFLRCRERPRAFGLISSSYLSSSAPALLLSFGFIFFQLLPFYITSQDYFVESTRGFKHFVAKVTIKDNLLYTCTAQAKEKDFPQVEAQLKRVVESFRVPA